VTVSTASRELEDAAAGERRALRSLGRPLSATITPPATSNATSATNHLGRNKPDPSFMESRPC
jgi:hypothetical protein